MHPSTTLLVSGGGVEYPLEQEKQSTAAARSLGFPVTYRSMVTRVRERPLAR